jgi:hypothetical protein
MEDQTIRMLYMLKKRRGDNAAGMMRKDRGLTGLVSAGQDRSNNGFTDMRLPAGLIPKDGDGLPY